VFGNAGVHLMYFLVKDTSGTRTKFTWCDDHVEQQLLPYFLKELRLCGASLCQSRMLREAPFHQPVANIVCQSYPALRSPGDRDMLDQAVAR